MDVEEKGVELPQPYWWEQPITAEQYEAFAPDGLGLVEGYLLGGPEDEEAKAARLRLLALLLTNVGLEEAVPLADSFHWREALERMCMAW